MGMGVKHNASIFSIISLCTVTDSCVFDSQMENKAYRLESIEKT